MEKQNNGQREDGKLMLELDNIYNMDCLDIWADIQGFEGKYKISNKGDVYSFKTKKLLKPILDQLEEWRKNHKIEEKIPFSVVKKQK